MGGGGLRACGAVLHSGWEMNMWKQRVCEIGTKCANGLFLNMRGESKLVALAEPFACLATMRYKGLRRTCGDVKLHTCERSCLVASRLAFVPLLQLSVHLDGRGRLRPPVLLLWRRAEAPQA